MKRVLFVDDDLRVLSGLRRLLATAPLAWETGFAASGAAALAELARVPYDVIVSDMRMPQMDGAALLCRVRHEHPQTVRIILSGHTDLEAVLRAVPVAHQFLAKPCDASTLRAVVERACNLQALLDSEALRELVSELDALPSSPRLYTALTEALAEPDVPLATIAAIVEQDAAMCAKCLQLVNSAFFGLARRITTIQQAVNYLGLNVLRYLVFSTEAFRAFEAEAAAANFSLAAFERHAALTAKIASALLKTQPAQAHEAFLAGMVHDIGKLVLVTRLPDQFAALTREAADAGRPVHELEREHLGVTHAEVGAYLLGLWGLPYAIVEAVAYHHEPAHVQEAKFSLLGAVSVANALAHEHAPCPRAGQRPHPQSLDEPYLTALGVLDQVPAWRALASQLANPEEPTDDHVRA